MKLNLKSKGHKTIIARCSLLFSPQVFRRILPNKIIIFCPSHLLEVSVQVSLPVLVTYTGFTVDYISNDTIVAVIVEVKPILKYIKKSTNKSYLLYPQLKMFRTNFVSNRYQHAILNPHSMLLRTSFQAL